MGEPHRQGYTPRYSSNSTPRDKYWLRDIYIKAYEKAVTDGNYNADQRAAKQLERFEQSKPEGGV